MTDYAPPCQTGDPNDWFIERDGRQYSDEPVLAVHEVEHLLELVKPEDRLEALEEATDERIRENIVKRRHAKDSCFRDCYMRTQCLGLALESDQLTYGIWGGYYPEEIRAIRRERDDRARRRRGVS